MVTFFTRIELLKPVSGLTLRIGLPEGLELIDYGAPDDGIRSAPRVQVDESGQHLVWGLNGSLSAGDRYEYETRARIEALEWNRILDCPATISSDEHGLVDEESVSLALWAKGRYLRYLPELYERDEFMGRFLMLFESFLAPIEGQVDTVPHYLDPRTTPTEFLAWLAGWLGLELDERLPQARQRELIRAAIWLYRRRGTKRALADYLEIYTGGKAQIVEHRAMDFVLGAQGRLGHGVAFGRGNRPHAFTVNLSLPAEGSAGDPRQEARYRRVIEEIIEAEKPAHTSYTLNINRES
jgi:phage tail-like protein